MYLSVGRSLARCLSVLSDRPVSLHTFFLRRIRIDKLACVFLFAAIVALAATTAQASDGDLDLTFGSGGKVITDFDGRSDIAQAVAIQSDGKIIVVGQSGDADLVFHSAVVRYNPNGSLDTTFGSGGRTLLPFDSAGDVLSSIVIQPDGKLVVAGALNQNNANNAFLVARLNPDGSVDTSFANGGKLVATFGDAAAQANGVALQPDGKIVAAGASGAVYGELHDIVLIRLDTNGAYDTTFGNGGKVRTHFPGETNTGSLATNVLLTPDGKIVATGQYKTEVIQRQFAAARYMPNGDLDPTFGNGGLVTTLLGAFSSYAQTSILQPDGKLVIGGYKDARHNNDFALARYNTDGSLDSTFGTGGIVVNDLFGSSDDSLYSLSLSSDRKLIASGATGQYPNFRFGLARYNTNGTFDTSFGAGGKILTEFGTVTSRSFGAALQPNGKIVLAGYTVTGTTGLDFNNQFAVARYNVAVHAKPFDFDGDGRSDISIFRPGPREWWINRSSNGGTTAGVFGASGDMIVPADYTGDTRTDIAVWRPSTGEWFIMRSEDFSFYAYPFGTAGDIPAPADFDGDNRADSAVFRPSSGTWYIQQSGGGIRIQNFGANGDQPVVADYDNDNHADMGVYRPSTGEWWLNRSTAGLTSFVFGTSTDKSVQADYTGDGKADVAFFRPATAEWLILRSEDQSFAYVRFGSSGDVAAPADYDGDGKADITVFRPSNGTWFSQRTTAGVLIQQFGMNGDRPVANAFVP